ncbi:MAG: NAD-binding protein [Oscillospiraceae bacterium]|nr:NAD-binding protein [Oscillospiraceae bacterium]
MHISVVGGDRRFRLLEGMLQARGHRINETALQLADAVVLPLPAFDAKGYIRGSELHGETLLAAQPQQPQLLLGGQLPAAFLQKAAARQITARDYYLDETLLLQNAAATAEGALSLLIAELPTVIKGSCIAVIGYGRIGSRLAKLLQSMGADVTVFARSAKARAQAAAEGISARPMQLLAQLMPRFAAVCSTVPALVAEDAAVQQMREGMLWLELASGAGGLCREAAAKRGVRVVDGGGLPGRFSPHSAAEYICEAVCRILTKEGFHA